LYTEWVGDARLYAFLWECDRDLAAAARSGWCYRGVARACLAVPRCRAVTMWGLSDRYTWLRTFFGFTNWPLPFGDAWERKPAYFGLRAALVEYLLGAS
jgi:endo-1,4-beta-xylanase